MSSFFGILSILISVESWLAASSPSMEWASINDVVLLDFARARRGKFEMPRPIKFNPRRIACGGDKVRPIQKFERLLQFPFWLGRVFQPNNGVCHLKS